MPTNNNPGWLRLLKYYKPVRLFITVIGIVISLAVMSIFIGIYYSNYDLIMETVKGQASSYFDLVVKAREWNAGHAGVYVEKVPGVETNPYLKQLGVAADIKSLDGRVFTLRNPALMTREMSELTRIEDGATFHITSDKLVNKDNAPDAFERAAIDKFKQGAKEVWDVDRSGDQPVFRYIGPLYITQSCMKCHYKLGYKIGDIRGGITVNFPFGSIDKQLKANRNMVVLLFLATIGLLLGTLYVMSSRLVNELSQAQKKLQEVSVTDELTGLKNRRFIMERLREESQKAKRTGVRLESLLSTSTTSRRSTTPTATCSGTSYSSSSRSVSGRAFARMMCSAGLAARSSWSYRPICSRMASRAWARGSGMSCALRRSEKAKT